MDRAFQKTGVPVFCLSIPLLIGAAVQLHLATQSPLDGGSRRLCRAYLCDDAAITQAAYQHQLVGSAPSLSIATQLLSDLLSRDPASARRWADLGDALAQGGAVFRASAAYDQALRIAPSSAEILVSAAAFYLRDGDREKGVRCVSRTLAVAPGLSDALSSYMASNRVTALEVLASGLPLQRQPVQFYLRYFMAQSDVPSANLLWQWSAANHLTDTRILVQYVNFLIAQEHASEAATTWESALGHEKRQYLKAEFVFNGGFEFDPIQDAPFDWAIGRSEHARIVRDLQAYSGGHSLRIDFDGSANVDFNEVSQMAVLPAGEYELQAYMRANEVTTDQGIFLRISDGDAQHRVIAETKAVVGSTPWRRLTASFVVARAPRIVEIRVLRRSSLRFDNKINGTVWIDQVSLRRIT
jgi:tetratricopeptide (TPR) repeat protein